VKINATTMTIHPPSSELTSDGTSCDTFSDDHGLFIYCSVMCSQVLVNLPYLQYCMCCRFRV